MNINDAVETVTIETKNGPVRINKSQYDADPKAYKLSKEDNKSDDADKTEKGGKAKGGKPDTNDKQSNTGDPSVTIPATALVTKVGDRFFVTDDKAAKVEFAGLDHEAGYETDAAAWNALAEARKPKQS